MKTAIFINTFAKMSNYDLDDLSKHDIHLIAIVAAEEYQKFFKAYGKYFAEIHSCTNTSTNPFEKISYNFATNIIRNEIYAQGDLVRIISLSEDNLLLAAQLRDDFSIPGMRFEQAQSFRDKTIMKDILRKNNIRTPHYVKFDNEAARNRKTYYNYLQHEIKLPFVLKPFNLLGGLGVVMVNSFEEFDSFCKTYEKEPAYEYEVEEFISGTLFHCDSIINNKEVLFSTCCEYTNPNFDFQNGKSVISIPLKKNDPVAQRIFNFNNEVLNAMKLDQGISHHELFITHKNEHVFLEIAARSPGAIITPMYRRSFNVAMEDIDFKMQMNIPFQLMPTYDTYYLSGILPTFSGTVKKLVSPDIKSKHEIKWIVKEGDQVSPSMSLRDKSATIIAWNDNYEELYNDFNFLKNYQSILVYQ